MSWSERSDKSSEAEAEVQKAERSDGNPESVHKQTQDHQEREEPASTFDINERSRKVHLHGPINK